MKKIILLLSFVACMGIMHAQNLLINPSFEAWTAGVPDGWLVPVLSSQVGSLTVIQETTVVLNGSNSLRMEIGATENPGFHQIIPITSGKTYTVSASYYVVSGDGSDARIWSTFKNETTAFVSADWTTAATTDATIQTKLQGSGSSAGGYFKIANGLWGTYTVDFVAPTNATSFVFEFRAYKGSIVIWDNMYFGEKTTGFSNPSVNKFYASVSDNTLFINNVANGSTVEIYSVLGAKVQTSQLVNGSIEMSNLTKGLYIVRVGKNTQKIML